ncbi:hypothetical protein BDZ85DRAFT_115098 [Elsinoe ampelina]|uniref:Gfd2/YDR514C-like C-terminal domain-containing protein n=1 Tax=Elsinoe ampelina TaxID=302913 RepID=A0A6A6GDN3_9PEZI|nr:hypothetical protein BDZ85DRAFT_115098 [Elsinoe ampelina]
MMSKNSASKLPEKQGHHRYVSFDIMRQLPTLVWKIKDFKKPDGVFNTFFGSDKFYSKCPWRFYYFWCDEINPDAPLILLHETDAKEFINRIKKRFPKDGRIIVPNPEEWPGVVADFKYFPGVGPTILDGEVRSRVDFDLLRDRATPFKLDPRTSSNPELMRLLQETIQQTTVCAAKNKKEKQAQMQALLRKSNTEALLRMQAVLGLEPHVPSYTSDKEAFDVNMSAPFSFHESAVIISVDVEAHERMKNIITEIGISTLDTNDLRGVPPGPLGIKWREKIRARHFRTSEYRYHINKDFINGCPDNFRNGVSEFVPGSDMARMVGTCFRPPFSGPSEIAPEKVTVFSGPKDAEVRWVDPTTGQEMKHNPVAPEWFPGGEPKRNIILLGHDTDNDIAYLRQVGYDIRNLTNIVHIADTCTLYSALTGNRNKTRLGKILGELDIEPWHLHNAGNDAWYTLAIAIGLAVGDKEGRQFGDQTATQDGAGVATSSAPPVISTSVVAPAPAPQPAPVAVEEEDLMTFDDPPETTQNDAQELQNVAAAAIEEMGKSKKATIVSAQPAGEGSTGSITNAATDDGNDMQNYDRLKENGGMLAYMASRLGVNDSKEDEQKGHAKNGGGSKKGSGGSEDDELYHIVNRR